MIERGAKGVFPRAIMSMLTASLNMPKPAGHALIVGSESSRPSPRKVLGQLGYEIDQRDDPYAAMLELCRRPLVYRAIVISLQSLYRDELNLISAVRRRFPHVSIWLTQTDGRQSALAEAMRLGAEALVSDDGIHHFADALPPIPAPPAQFRPAPQPPPEDEHPAPAPVVSKTIVPPPDEPVLTAEELRALLGDEV